MNKYLFLSKLILVFLLEKFVFFREFRIKYAFLTRNLLITIKINIYIMKLSNLLILALLVLSGSLANAQSIKDFKKDIRDVKKATNLTEKQVGEITAVYQKIVDDIASLEQMNLSEEEFRTKRRAIYTGAEFSLEQVINADQKAAYEKHKRVKREMRAQNIKKLRKQNASVQDLMDAEAGVKSN